MTELPHSPLVLRSPNNEYAILARLFQYDIQLLLQHNELLGIGIVEREKLWRPPLQNKMNEWINGGFGCGFEPFFFLCSREFGEERSLARAIKYFLPPNRFSSIRSKLVIASVLRPRWEAISKFAALADRKSCDAIVKHERTADLEARKSRRVAYSRSTSKEAQIIAVYNPL